MPQPPNFRIGLLEDEYEGELITALDVIEYYATYGHNANIKSFHLLQDFSVAHPSPYYLRVCKVCLNF